MRIRKSTAKRLPTLFFVVAGVLVLGITGFMLSDAGKKFYEPQPGADSETPHYCDYGIYPRGECTNSTDCPSGRSCRVGPLNGAEVKYIKCVTYSTNQQQIMDCCKQGVSMNSEHTACVNPTSTPTPTKHYCDYGSNPKGTCSNTSCDIGGSGLDCRPEWVANALRRQCLSASSTDMIKDCCGAGATVKGSPGNFYCDATSTATPTPTKTNCTYGSYPLGTCSNSPCPSGRYCTSWHAVSNADPSAKKCKSVSSSTEQIMDCCPAGMVFSDANKTSCVSAPNPTSTSTPTSTATPNPTTTPPGTKFCTSYTTSYKNRTCINAICAKKLDCAQQDLAGDSYRYCIKRTTVEKVYSCCKAGVQIVNGSCAGPTDTVTPAPSDTVTSTPSDTDTPTPSDTATPPPSDTVTPPPSDTEPPPSGTVTPTPSVSSTPSITHTAAPTGFVEDILLYIGGALYAIGVFAFVAARYLGVARRKPVGK